MRRPSGRFLGLLLALALVAVTVLVARHALAADKDGPSKGAASRPLAAGSSSPQLPHALTERSVRSLAAPVQDPATAAAHSGVLLAGGLTAADTSTDQVVLRSGTGDRLIGRLPGAQHDAAAVSLGGSVYVFGGGNAVAQLDHILRIDPASGSVRQVGRLPAPCSDVAAAVVGGTAYVVGGFTGTRWLDTIVAWRPGRGARIVGRLRVPLRYAAVAAVANTLVIAGGSTPAGVASRAVSSFDPSTHRLRRIGSLPAPTTHAAAASRGGVVYVIGGRGNGVATQTARIVAVDPAAGRVTRVGMLRQPLSDVGAASWSGGILVAGGRARGGTVAAVGELVPDSPRTGNVPLARPRRRSSYGAQASRDVYAHALSGMLATAVRSDPSRVYVPNSGSNTVDEIDPLTFRVVREFPVGALPQHITPSYDLKTLYVNNDVGNSLTPIDPRTGKAGSPIPVDDPYNLYFTPGGRLAIIVAERLHRLDFRNAQTFRLHKSLGVPCAGVNHMDFSSDGRYAVASCEFSGQLIKLDLRHERVIGVLTLRSGHAIPQDVRLAPNGRLFYVADLEAGGVWKVDGARFRVVGFDHTGAGAHGLVISRNAKLLYVANRNDGSVSVISFRTTQVVGKWRLPGGGSPDMGGVSSDGRVLWLSGRYNSVVYAISTRTGRLLARIPVGASPHGVLVYPQPGRYSLGHVGILR